MDLIIVFIIFSIVMNIIGASKKQNKRQTTVRRTPKSSASRGRDFRSLLEDDTFMRPKKHVPDNRTAVAEKTIDNSFIDNDMKPLYTEVKKPLKMSSPLQEIRRTPTIGLTEMQRAIVMAEVLGKPKALKR